MPVKNTVLRKVLLTDAGVASRLLETDLKKTGMAMRDVRGV